MKTRHFCTYFDHNYLPRAMVMLESLHTHNPHAHVYVLCLSDQCYDGMQKLAYPFVTLIQLTDFEAANPELMAVRPTRSLVEYYFTMTPCLPWHILHTVDGINAVTYLDADMMFFSSVEPIFEEAGDASVILTPHRFSSDLQDRVRYGIYNVSWITFCKTESGLACLAWYKKACLNWCYDRYEQNGKEERFADQKYLDYFPLKFSGVHSVQHKGAGVAPWNIKGSSFYLKDSCVIIDHNILIFYHAQAFNHLWWKLYASGLGEYNVRLCSVLRKGIFFPYCKRYEENKNFIKNLLKHEKIISQRNTIHLNSAELFKKTIYEISKNSIIFNIVL